MARFAGTVNSLCLAELILWLHGGKLEPLTCEYSQSHLANSNSSWLLSRSVFSDSGGDVDRPHAVPCTVTAAVFLPV